MKVILICQPKIKGFYFLVSGIFEFLKTSSFRVRFGTGRF